MVQKLRAALAPQVQTVSARAVRAASGVGALYHGVVRPYLYVRGLLFRTSADYWDRRYRRGGTSGPGSRGVLAAHKAEYVNAFIRDRGVGSVVDLGCGDGRQLALLDAPAYLGVDVSPHAVARCRARFAGVRGKRFAALADYQPDGSFDLALSLDVVFHLVEDDVFERYMAALFASAARYVVVYSSDRDGQDPVQEPHVRHRRYSAWVSAHAPGWRVVERQANPHAAAGGLASGSFASFTAFARDAD